MTAEQIEQLFQETLVEIEGKKGIYNQLTRIDKQLVYNWKHNRVKHISLGDKLEFLFELNKIQINGPTNS